MKYVILVRTESGKRFHRFTGRYASERDFSLMRKLRFSLPDGERLKSAEVAPVKGLIETLQRLASAAASRIHAHRTAPGILADARKLLIPPLDEDDYVSKALAQALGEPLP